MTRREKQVWLAITALSIIAVIGICLLAPFTGTTAEAAPSTQSSETRTVDWYYWLDTGTRTIKRSRLDGSGVTETIVTSSEMWAPRDFDLDPGRDYVYWTEDGYNQIRRKAADGTGSFETLVSSGLSQPWRIAVDGSHVYWADNGNDTIKRVPLAGGNVTQLAGDSTNPISNVTAIDVHGNRLYWADNGNDSVRRVSVSGGAAAILVSSGLTAPHDIEVDPDGDYVYVLDRNGASSAVKRVANVVNGAVTTLADNNNAVMDNPVALTLDPEGGYVYWLDEDDDAVRRVAADGAAGTFETVTIAGYATDRDLLVSRGSGSVYWLASNRIRRVSTGGGVAQDVIATGLSSPVRIRRAVSSETINGSCIADAGTIAADYDTHDWTGYIDATCPRAFYRFTVSDDADLRVTATSSGTDPVPLLRKGGLDGEIAALTSASSGASAPYVHTMASGEYTIELARSSTSSARNAASFAAKLQTQPALEGCDVNLGTLSSEQLQVFGAYDTDCGNTRKYFFYLEFQASISVSASGVGFTPRIELRPGSQSDVETPLAQDTQNPADIFQQVSSGSYRINLELITKGDTYDLTFQAFGLPPPTRTPMPTPTPRFQPNVDVRMDPDPRSVRYELGHVYRFRLEGGEGSFPAIVRTGDQTAFPLTTEPDSELDCSAAGQVDNIAQLQVLYLHVCGDAVSSAIEVIKASDYSLLAQYPLYVAGATPPAPSTIPVAGAYVAPPEDRIGLSILINALCEGANVPCQVDLIRNAIGGAAATVLFAVPTQVARGRPSRYAYGIGIAGFILGLLMANYLIGTPPWWGAVCIIGVFALFLAGAYLKFRRLGA